MWCRCHNSHSCNVAIKRPLIFNYFLPHIANCHLALWCRTSLSAFLLYQNSSVTPACFGYIWRKWKCIWNGVAWYHLPGIKTPDILAPADLKSQLRWLHNTKFLALCYEPQHNVALKSLLLSHTGSSGDIHYTSCVVSCTNNRTKGGTDYAVA